VLGKNGVDCVFEAADGAAALRAMRDARPPVNLVFCDLDMPGMDGVDTLRRIALAHPDVSIVVFSGMDPRVLSTVAQMSETQGLEVLGVLGKPFSDEEVRSLLDRWRQARRASVRVKRAELTAEEIRAALDADCLEVYYQLQTRMSDGEPFGVEALVRLNDPHLGVLSPASFLPMAEASGLMPDITLRVLEQSLAQAARWTADGLMLTLAVNLAPNMLRRLDLPDVIAGIAAKHGFAHDRLTLEVTENHSELGPEMLHNAARLRIKGFQLSVDDFGTGDSGIVRLRNLPFTELKIDGSFVSEALDRDDLRSMLRTSVDLGHRLGMNVVAEGVETWDQWRLLRGYECDSAQGFLAAPALPAAQIPECMAGWRARVRGQQSGGPLH
jgi:EAL domain-containing protein (putative c-di-GMP-specific phosphodiesterase class I)